MWIETWDSASGSTSGAAFHPLGWRVWIDTWLPTVGATTVPAFHPLGWRVWIETLVKAKGEWVNHHFTRWDGGCGLKQPVMWTVGGARKHISPAGMAGVD